MKNRLTAFLAVFVVAMVGAGFHSGHARAVPCFGAPASFASEFNTDYPEPRGGVSSQEWWLEGPGDVTTSIASAMAAKHQHYETCFPFMETWNESAGSIRLDMAIQAHEYQGGTIQNVNGLGFLDDRTVKVVFNPAWQPTSSNEVRRVSVSRTSSSIVRCGRVESRNHVEGLSPNGHERQFSSTGWQSIFNCTGGRSNSADRGPGIIFRGWYQGADYCNMTFTDDFRGSAGYKASEMSVPVTGDLKLSFNVASCSNPRWLVMLNPDIHNGSYGTWVARGTGESATVTIPRSALPASGVFRVAAAACETVGSSTANPNGGQNCGVGVLPFTTGGSSPPPPPPPPPVPQCSDGVDNADPEDTLVDLADPGCTDSSDNDETNSVTPPPPPPPTGSASLTDDAYVLQTTPTGNFGNETTVRAWNGGTSSYLKFSLPEAASNLSVTFTVVDAGPGGCLRAVSDNSWTESTITYNTRPLAIATQGSCHPELVAVGAKVKFQLGPLAAGVYSYALTDGTSDAIRYGSTEHGTAASRPLVATQ